jgi:hypothetical protein
VRGRKTNGGHFQAYHGGPLIYGSHYVEAQEYLNGGAGERPAEDTVIDAKSDGSGARDETLGARLRLMDAAPAEGAITLAHHMPCGLTRTKRPCRSACAGAIVQRGKSHLARFR